jgi:hypothetical protein
MNQSLKNKCNLFNQYEVNFLLFSIFFSLPEVGEQMPDELTYGGAHESVILIMEAG